MKKIRRVKCILMHATRIVDVFDTLTIYLLYGHARTSIIIIIIIMYWNPEHNNIL